ncbi:MAG TPA: hypothetical protein VNG04_12685 [Candidatus Acidoferrum sp.]|nr:hypothetical protein [Candidatus Acidoferrum sp.]
MSNTKPPSPHERQIEATRCGVCGLAHPFLTVCPFIEEREIRYDYALDGEGRRRARARTERVRYYPRPEVFEALTEAITPRARKRRPRRTPA